MTVRTAVAKCLQTIDNVMERLERDRQEWLAKKNYTTSITIYLTDEEAGAITNVAWEAGCSDQTIARNALEPVIVRGRTLPDALVECRKLRYTV